MTSLMRALVDRHLHRLVHGAQIKICGVRSGECDEEHLQLEGKVQEQDDGLLARNETEAEADEGARHEPV